MNRRSFGMTALGIVAAARILPAQAPGVTQVKPQPGSLKEKMHRGQQIKMAAAKGTELTASCPSVRRNAK